MHRLVILLILIPLISEACTTFCLKFKDELIFGKNYDWNVDIGLVYINKRDISKRSFPDKSGRQVDWRSKYGSVTFNQYGREFPSGGINETALAIELMWLDDTDYPDDKRPAVDCLQWIQFQLDQSANINDIIANDKHLRIGSQGKIHFLVSDANGNSYAIEFLNGQLVLNPSNALTNDTFQRSDRYAKSGLMNPYSKGSLDRFATAQKLVKNYDRQELIPYGFQILDQVAQRNTKWSIIYDLKDRKIYFRSKRFRSIKSLAMSDFDFSPDSPVRYYDINQADTGDIADKFQDYQLAVDEAILRSAVRQTRFITNTPDSTIHRWATFPQNYTGK
ncbi:MAG: hypothetical protein KDD94_03380 [Calditrichaeota bacterium]|nr:hypothetical protein [Calditrichota bacterium]